MPSPSPDADREIGQADQGTLLAIARDAVRIGLGGDADWRPDETTLSTALRVPAATFVTLRRHDDLLGCIGTMEPRRSLAADVAANASGAAFADPRLPSVTWDDFGELAVKISVLGPMVPVRARSFDELRATVRPGIDGLLIAARSRRATFLPSVWEQVPDFETFIGMLWQKAGIPAATWPRRLQIHRYETFEFGD